MAEMVSSSSGSSFVSVSTPTESSPKETESSKEACSICAFSSEGNIREASYYCHSCSIFGRYICTSCIPRHAEETANHVFKYIPDYKDKLANNASNTRKDAEYAEELLKKTKENLSRYQEEISKTKKDLAEKEKKIKELESTIGNIEKKKNEKGQKKGHTDKEIAELTAKIKKLNEDKTELQWERKILLHTIDNLNDQIKAEGRARELLDRLEEVIGVNKTQQLQIEKLEKQLRLNTEDVGSSTGNSATIVATVQRLLDQISPGLYFIQKTGKNKKPKSVKS